MTSDRFADHTRRDFMRIAGSGVAVLTIAARPQIAGAQTPITFPPKWQQVYRVASAPLVDGYRAVGVARRTRRGTP